MLQVEQLRPERPWEGELGDKSCNWEVGFKHFKPQAFSKELNSCSKEEEEFLPLKKKKLVFFFWLQNWLKRILHSIGKKQQIHMKFMTSLYYNQLRKPLVLLLSCSPFSWFFFFNWSPIHTGLNENDSFLAPVNENIQEVNLPSGMGLSDVTSLLSPSPLSLE